MASDISQIELRCNETANESLEATTRMLRLAEEAKEAGIKILVDLDDQGEQLDRAEDGLKAMNADLKEAEGKLHEMDKCCGLCIPFWKKREDNDQYIFEKSENDQGGVVNDQPRFTVVDSREGGPGGQGGYVTKILDDAREEAMDQNLQEVSDIVHNLRNMAIDIGVEVSNQNSTLDRIQQQTEANKTRVSSAQKRTEALCKK